MITYGTPASVADVGRMQRLFAINPSTSVHANATQMNLFPGMAQRPVAPPAYITGPNPGMPYAQAGQGSLLSGGKPKVTVAQYNALLAEQQAAQRAAAPAASRFSRILAASPAALKSMVQSARSLPGAAGKIVGIGGMAYGLADTMFNPRSAEVQQLLAKEQADTQAAYNMRNYQPRNAGAPRAVQLPEVVNTYDAMGNLTGEVYNPTPVSAPVQAYTPAARSVMPTQSAPAQTFAQPVPTYSNPNLPVYDKALEDASIYAQPVPTYSNPNLPVYDKALEDMSVYPQQPPALVTMPAGLVSAGDTMDAGPLQTPPGWFWDDVRMNWVKVPDAPMP